MNYGIYKITNIKTKKVYIGSSENLSKRLRDHKNDLISGIHKNFKLQNSWNKHGEENFTFEVILLCAQQDLISNEQMFIDFFSVERMYNICLIAGNTKGYKHTEEAKLKIGRRSLGNSHGKGRKISEEHKQKLVEFNTGRKHSQKTKEKISKLHKGKPKSEDHKRKIADTLRGKPLCEKAMINSHTPEARERQSKIMLGKKWTQEQKDRHSKLISSPEYQESRKIARENKQQNK